MSLRAFTDAVGASLKRLTMQHPSNGLASSQILLPRGIASYRRGIGDGTSNAIITACVGWMGRTFPEAPVQVQERQETGKWSPMAEHSMVSLIENPNPFYSGVMLWMATIWDLHLSGNAYWQIETSRNGRAIRLWYTPSVLIEPKWDQSGRNFITHYEYKPSFHLKPIPLKTEDVVHLRFGLDPENPRLGRSPLASVIREVYTDDEAALFTASLLKNLGIPGVVITPGDADVEIDEDAAEAAKIDFSAKFGGDKRGEPLIMSVPANIQVLSFSPEEMHLKDLRRIPEERVTAVLGTPAMIVGLGAGLDASTYNNIAEAREAVYENTILPLHRMIGADLTNQLLRRFEGEEGLRRRRVGFDTSNVRVLQEDRQRLAQEIRVLTASGIMKVKDAKGRLNEAGYNLDIDEVADDVYIRQLSTVEVPSGETRWEHVFPEVGESEVPSGTTSGSGPTDGGPGASGGNLGERVTVDALSAGAITQKTLDDAIDKIAHGGFYAKHFQAAEQVGYHAGFSAKQWQVIKQLGLNADDLIQQSERLFERMFRLIARDIVHNMSRGLVRRSIPTNGGTATKQADPELAEMAQAIADGERSVDEVMEDFNEKYLLPLLVVLWGSVSQRTFEQVSTDLGVSIPWEPDSVLGADVLRTASQRVRLIDINRQAREAVMRAVVDGVTAGEPFEDLALRISHYVEGSDLYPGIAREHGDAAARLHRARVIAETEVRFAQNVAAAHAMEQSGLVEELLIYDGPGCGWMFHDDPDTAHLSIRTFAEFRDQPLAHPRCVRAPGPVLKREF